MANPDGPRRTVKGREVGYFNLKGNLLVQGENGPALDMPDIQAVNYQSTRTPGKAGGPGSIRRTRRTRGARTYTNSMVMYRSGWVTLKQRLHQIAKERGLVDERGDTLYGEVSFTLKLTYSWLDDEAIQVIQLFDSQIIDESEAVAEGEAPNQITIGLDTIVNREQMGGPEDWTTL
jgi:hypothetical protein